MSLQKHRNANTTAKTVLAAQLKTAAGVTHARCPCAHTDTACYRRCFCHAAIAFGGAAAPKPGRGGGARAPAGPMLYPLCGCAGYPAACPA